MTLSYDSLLTKTSLVFYDSCTFDLSLLKLLFIWSKRFVNSMSVYLLNSFTFALYCLISSWRHLIVTSLKELRLNLD